VRPQALGPVSDAEFYRPFLVSVEFPRHGKSIPDPANVVRIKQPQGHKIQDGIPARFAVDDVDIAYPYNIEGESLDAEKRGQKATQEKNARQLHENLQTTKPKYTRLEHVSKIAELKKQIIASAILREAGRLAGGNTRIHTGALMFAVEDYKKVLAEMEKNGL